MTFSFMSRQTTILILLFSLLLITSCASHNHVSQDFKPDTDFSVYKTFTWNSFSSEITDSNKENIQAAVEQALIQQGFQLVKSNPDMLLDMNIIIQQSTGGSSGVSLSIGLPIGNHGAIGLGTSKLLSQDTNKEGLIILDITAQKTHQAIWRGNLSGIPISYFSLKNQAKLNVELSNLAAQFPPKKS